MRKGQRFTPARLDRWERRGRGAGTRADYQPWHQVTRDDPGSQGRSHLPPWRFGRLHHLLSDEELIAFGFASMLPGLADVREQFPLSRDEHQAEINSYRLNSAKVLPGTLIIARELGLRHPQAKGGGTSRPWTMSTDLLLTLRDRASGPHLLAISVKYDADLAKRRTRELLRIEQEYWRRQDQPWLLLTPTLHSPTVAKSMLTGLPWALSIDQAPSKVIDGVGALARDIRGRTMRRVLQIVGSSLCVDERMSQLALWQAIWQGRLPLDLARPMRPDQPLELVSTEAFWLQNPIASGRSAWTF